MSLLNFESKLNIIKPAYMIKLNLQVLKTNISAQIINSCFKKIEDIIMTFL